MISTRASPSVTVAPNKPCLPDRDMQVGEGGEGVMADSHYRCNVT